MTFLAHIRRQSATWSAWLQQHYVGGTLAGILFRWKTGNHYVSDPLTPEQIAQARSNRDITLEVVDAPPAEMTVPEPVKFEPPKPAPSKVETLRLQPKPEQKSK